MKRIGIAALLLAVLVVAVFASLPWLLSAQNIKTQIEDEMSRLSGQSVSLEGDADVSLRPYLGLRFSNVRIADKVSGTHLLMVDQLQVQLGASSVLIGNPEVKAIRLLRPQIKFAVDKDGVSNWSKSALMQSGQSSQNQIAERGSVSFMEGIVAYSDARSGANEEATALSGTFVWSGGKSIAMNLAGIWNGEAFDTKLSASNAATLLRQEKSAVEFNLSSSPLNLTYEGKVTSNETYILDGRFDAKSSSPTRLAQWIKRPLPSSRLMKLLALSGDIKGAINRPVLSQATATIGDATGTGRLSFAITRKILSINGTLAFDTIVLPTIAELARTPEGQLSSEASVAQGLAMDVRLSSNTAQSGPLEMSGLAASIFVKDGKALFDIAQADALDGQIAGTIEPLTGSSNGFKTDLKLTNVDLERLARLYGEGTITLEGRGNASFKLESAAQIDTNTLTRLNGSGSISGENGILRGVNLEAVTDGLEKPEAIRSSDVFSTTTSYDELNLAFFIANGIAFFQDTKLVVGDTEVSLSGRSDLSERNLALQGRVIQAKDKVENSTVDAAVSLPFLIGGTASAPLFIPLPTALQNSGPPNTIPEIKATD